MGDKVNRTAEETTQGPYGSRPDFLWGVMESLSFKKDDDKLAVSAYHSEELHMLVCYRFYWHGQFYIRV